MRLRSSLAAASCVFGLVIVLAGSGPAVPQDEPKSKAESPRDSARGRERVIERIQVELEQLRRALDDERGRQDTDAQAARGTSQEESEEGIRGRERADRPERIPVSNTPWEIAGEEVTEAPGAVDEAAAQVEAARVALEMAEHRVSVWERKIAIVAKQNVEGATLDGELTLAQCKVEVAEARARLVEAAFRLGEARRVADEIGEAVAEVEEAGSKFTVDDALDTADRVIGILKSFKFDDRPR